MNLQLNGKVIIVSGGVQGIGRSVSRELVREHAIPVIIDRSAPAGISLEKEFVDDGRDGLFIHATLEDERISRKIIDQTIMKFGRVDGIVNNAGMNDGVGLQNGTLLAFRSSVLANLSYYYDLVHFSVEQLIKNKGSIVNISSKIAVTGQGGTSGYAASKGAQLAWTREWAVELAPYGIRVNAICQQKS